MPPDAKYSFNERFYIGISLSSHRMIVSGMAKKNESDNRVRFVTLGTIRDRRGNLSVVENGRQLPFVISRTYWVYDIPGGKDRGGHAYRNGEEIIISLSGSFEVLVNDGCNEQVFVMNRCNRGLYLPAGTWRQMRNFATNSIALVICSTPYTPRDYIRDFEKFIEFKKNGNP